MVQRAVGIDKHAQDFKTSVCFPVTVRTKDVNYFNMTRSLQYFIEATFSKFVKSSTIRNFMYLYTY